MLANKERISLTAEAGEGSGLDVDGAVSGIVGGLDSTEELRTAGDAALAAFLPLPLREWNFWDRVFLFLGTWEPQPV
jgi:hypothetical protein